jgi:hypothetical protein
MNDPKHNHPHGDPNGGSNVDGRPYWKRAHRGWPFWVAVALMLAAMIVYVMSDDLAGWPNGKPLPQPPGTVIK